MAFELLGGALQRVNETIYRVAAGLFEVVGDRLFNVLARYSATSDRRQRTAAMLRRRSARNSPSIGPSSGDAAPSKCAGVQVGPPVVVGCRAEPQDEDLVECVHERGDSADNGGDGLSIET